MSDLSDAVNALNTVVQTITGNVQPLKDALKAAQDALAALQVQDDADKAALAAALQDASNAVTAINADVAALQAVVPPAQ